MLLLLRRTLQLKNITELLLKRRIEQLQGNKVPRCESLNRKPIVVKKL